MTILLKTILLTLPSDISSNPIRRFSVIHPAQRATLPGRVRNQGLWVQYGTVILCFQKNNCRQCINGRHMFCKKIRSSVECSWLKSPGRLHASSYYITLKYVMILTVFRMFTSSNFTSFNKKNRDFDPLSWKQNRMSKSFI